MSWIVVDFGPFNHIVPESEIEDHYPTGCRCMPVADPDDGTVIIHNSFDGREWFERYKGKQH